MQKSEFNQLPVMQLAAIWLTEPIIYNGVRTVRITPGMKVTIKDGKMVDTYDQPTHEVSACMGLPSSDFLQFHIRDLYTGETQFLTRKLFNDPVNHYFTLERAYQCEFCRAWFDETITPSVWIKSAPYCSTECHKAEQREIKGERMFEYERN